MNLITTIETNTFFAVQIGDDNAWDFGAYDMETAIGLAKFLAEDSAYDGLEIRVATIDVAEAFCDSVIVVREGTSF